MDFFTVEVVEEQVEITEIDPDAPPGEPQGIGKAIKSTVQKLIPKNVEITPAQFRDNLRKCMVEARDAIAEAIKTAILSPNEWATLEQVEIEFGIKAGGDIGFFVKGRLDIGSAIKLKYKIAPPKPKAAEENA